MSGLLQKAYLVPGQPHILLGADRNVGWASLKASYEADIAVRTQQDVRLARHEVRLLE